jgi:hypothetical protein
MSEIREENKSMNGRSQASEQFEYVAIKRKVIVNQPTK